MSLLEALAVVVAGCAAGTINTIVGSGSMITFPTLMAVGLPPLTANVTNSLGIAPGSLSGAIGYRRELRHQRGRTVRLAAASFLGALGGAVLLLTLPSSAFDAIVPVLVALGIVLVVAQPWLKKHLTPPDDAPAHGGAWVWLAVLATGVYGGYFGAAQGVLLMAILGVGLPGSIQEHNAVKNVLALVANLTAAVVFVLVADVDWVAALLVAVGAVVGGQIGATVGRRMPATLLRAVIVAVGVVAIVMLVR